MDTKEIHRRKHKLEAQINELVAEFEKSTDASVERITVERQLRLDGKSDFITVETEIKT